MNQINWMKTSREYWEGKQDTIKKALNNIKWQELKKGMKLPLMPGEGIKTMIREFKLPKVSHIAISCELVPYGLYGVYAHFKNADVKVFCIDEGDRLSSLCQEVEYKDS